VAVDGGHDRAPATGTGPRPPDASADAGGEFRCSEAEYAAIAAAARGSGLTSTGYAAEAALAAARGSQPPHSVPWREALTELMAARAQVRRFGNNVNQAVRVLNTTGELPAGLLRAAASAADAVTQLDRAAVEVARRVT
jgi:hypothetical protein